MHTRLIADITQYVENMLSGLQGHFYHHFWHALEISARSVEIAKKEGRNQHEQELLEIAWLFHDVGFIERYEKNEPIWAEIAKQYLTNIHYPTHDTETIVRLILATDMYIPATDILENIIKDADIDNLGRDDFWEKWEWLRQEIMHIAGKEIPKLEWYKSSLKLMQQAVFLTRTNQLEREPKKQENIQILQEKISQLSSYDNK